MSAQKEQFNLQGRPPVVAIVGHVDHGKTTLLDYIRKTRVAAKEAGGITQSIGAYEVIHAPHESQTVTDGTQINADNTQMNADKSARISADKNQRESASDFPGGARKITFIDTPGHEAFSRMRAHGTAAADLAILVVAADDGVKPHTKEAIQILKKTETPFIVAITKIDSPNANIDKVKNELLGEEVLLEGYGGNVSWHGVSGVTGEGVADLLELILLTGEVAGLTFDKEAKASGFVIESKMDSRRGVVVHVILKDGVLRRGDLIATSTASGKVKILENFLGRPVKELLPSAPATIIGFENPPRTGEEFQTGKIDPSTSQSKTQTTPPPKTEAKPDDKSRLRVILKADTAGSLEALEQVLGNLIEIKEVSVGKISDGDVQFAKSTGSVIIGFSVEPDKSAARLADYQRVKIITSDIIYKLMEAVEEILKGEALEKARAALEVLAIFSVGGSKKTVGGKVIEGILRVGNNVEVEREMAIVGKGRITNLQRNKEDAREVPEGSECGLVIGTEANIEVGDILRVL